MSNRNQTNNCSIKLNSDELVKTLMSDFILLDTKGTQSAHSRIRKNRNVYSDNEVPIPNGQRKKLNKSFYKGKKIKKVVNKMIASLTEPILRNQHFIAVDSLTGSSHKEEVLNYQWNYVVGKTKIVKELARYFLVDGIAIVKVNWDLNTETTTKTIKVPVFTDDPVEIESIINLSTPERREKLLQIYKKTKSIPKAMKDEEVKVTKILDNKPVIEVIDPLTVYLSKDSSYLYHTYELTYAEVMVRREEFESQIKFILNTLKGKETYREPSPINEDTLETSLDSSLFDYYEQMLSEDAVLANKKVKFIDYWGNITDSDGKVHSVVATILSDKLVRLDKNPLGILPFAVGQLEITTDTPYSEGIPALLEEEQIGLNRTLRIIDNSTMNYDNDQKLIDESFLPDVTQKNNYNAGRTTYFRRGMDPSKAIHNNAIGELPKAIFDLQMFFSNEIELTTAQHPDQLGPDGSPVDPVDSVEAGRLRNFMELFTTMFTVLGEMNHKFLQHDYDISNNLKANTELLSMSGTYIAVDTITSRERDKKVSQIINLLGTQSAHMSEETLMLHYKKLAKLWDHSDLANGIKKEMDTPKPVDPMMELQIEQVKLENAKLQIELELIKANAGYYNARALEQTSKAVERYGNVQSGVSDAEVRNLDAQSSLYNAQTGKFEAQSQLFNQEFHLVDTGKKEEEKQKELEFKHLASLESEQVRTDRELKSNELKHKNAQEQKVAQETKEQPLSPLTAYIKNGTLSNASYDAADDVYRNILTKNSLDTEKYLNPNTKGNQDGSNI